ncbi:hypothetical protein GTP38_25535, partial [Duganella sp. FT94W]
LKPVNWCFDRQAALAEALGGAAPRVRFGVLPAPAIEPLTPLTPFEPLAPLPQPLDGRGKRYLSSAEFEQKMGRGTGIVSVGLLRESGGAPGMQQSMSMLLSTRPTTRFTALSLGYALSPRAALVAMASYGKSDGIGNPDSLLAQVSAVRTLAYSAGYVRRQLWADNDRLALTWSMPAKVRAAAGAGVVAAADLGGVNAAALGAARLNLRPTASERDLEFSYTRLYGRDGRHGRLTGALMWRVNPGHDANARPDLLTGVRYSYGF